MYRSDPLAERIEQLLAPLLLQQGYELVLVEYVPRSHVVRLYIDGTNGVTLDDCTAVSRWASDLFDAEGISDEIQSQYHLEVSSPGLDRPLVKPNHFQRFVGQDAQVTVRDEQYGKRRFTGKLVAADDSGFDMSIEGQTKRFGYEVLERARLVPQW